jgi:hypothetical protein
MILSEYEAGWATEPLYILLALLVLISGWTAGEDNSVICGVYQIDLPGAPIK